MINENNVYEKQFRDRKQDSGNILFSNKYILKLILDLSYI